MIAGIDGAIDAAFETRQAPDHQRHAGRSGLPFGPFEAAVGFERKAVREILLEGGEEAEAEVGGGLEMGKHGRAVVDTDQDERRRERNRGEGIDGEAVRIAGGVQSGGNGDAGGEVAAGTPEQQRVESLWSNA